MAFTGVAVFAEVSSRVVRITGLSLAATASGVFGLNGDVGAEIQLPDGFQPENYSDIDLAESVEVSIVNAQTPVGTFAEQRLGVTKVVGPPFRITINNGLVAVSGPMEIFMRFH